MYWSWKTLLDFLQYLDQTDV